MAFLRSDSDISTVVLSFGAKPFWLELLFPPHDIRNNVAIIK
jgi:hypothetical protein